MEPRVRRLSREWNFSGRLIGQIPCTFPASCVLGGLGVRDQGACVHAQACACLYVWGADAAMACTRL